MAETGIRTPRRNTVGDKGPGSKSKGKKQKKPKKLTAG
jgi:hypothetical protein